MDLAAVLIAIGGVLTTVGGGVAFVWGKIEGRFKAIETKLEAANRQLDECKERDRSSRSLMSEMIFAMRMLADEVGASNPASPALVYVRQMLARVFPIAPTSQDMIDKLGDLP